MRCLNSFRLRNPNYPDLSDVEFIDCACGKCFPCLVNRRNNWLFRLFHESLDSVCSYFVTLTYSDDNCDGYLHSDHFRNFVKSLRHYLGSLKYYGIGEFGTRTLRPHYHLILFLKDPLYSSFDFVSDAVSNAWKYGFVQCDFASTSAMNYVLHYHVRPKYPFGDSTPEDRKKKTFFRCSKGLGLSPFLDEDGDFRPDILHSLASSSFHVMVDFLNRRFVIPRYYIKKAKDSGYDVLDVKLDKDGLSPSQCMIRLLFPDVVFHDDGSIDGISEEKYLSLLNDFKRQSDFKLERYNYQTKTSL